MIDKLKGRTYQRILGRWLGPVLIGSFLGVFLLLTLSAPGLAGAVREGNAGREGSAMALQTLPVPGKTTLVDFYSPFLSSVHAPGAFFEEVGAEAEGPGDYRAQHQPARGAGQDRLAIPSGPTAWPPLHSPFPDLWPGGEGDGPGTRGASASCGMAQGGRPSKAMSGGRNLTLPRPGRVSGWGGNRE